MRRMATALAAAALSAWCVFYGTLSPAVAGAGHGTQANPCAVPNEIVGSVEETAWRIWVAATCPVNTNPALYPFVVWETWIEQSQLYPADPSQGLIVPNAGASAEAHPLHGSPLALTYHPGSLTQVPPGLGSPPGAPNTNCNAANAPPPNNTGPNGNNPLTICEEVVKAVRPRTTSPGPAFGTARVRRRRPAMISISNSRGRRSRSRPTGYKYQQSAITLLIATISRRLG